MYVYTGSYTDHKVDGHVSGEGIYRFDLERESGKLSDLQLVATAPNPNFVLLSQDRTRLYAAAEAGLSGEPVDSSVILYDVDSHTGELTFRAEEKIGISGPCHLSLDPQERAVFVGCYTGGGAVMRPLDSSGNLRTPIRSLHSGSSVNLERQEAPHPHSANITADGCFLHVPDLGIDRVVTYRVGYDPEKLTRIGEVASTAGAGPRHLAFAPDSRFAYVVGEMASTIMVFRCEGNGKLTLLQTLSSLPVGFSGKKSAADVRIHPCGHVVYVSNRGHDSIAVFRVNKGSGGLDLMGHVPTGGHEPRGFNVDPSGEWLLAANEQSGSVFSFRVDGEDGMPVPSGYSISVPRPTCVAFALA